MHPAPGRMGIPRKTEDAHPPVCAENHSLLPIKTNKMYKLNFHCTRTLCDGDPVTIRHSEEAISVLRPLFPEENSWREACHAVFTDNKNRVLGTFLVGLGGSDSVPIDNKAIAAAALSCMAHGVILTHNHPSGDPKPSEKDISATERLKRALATLDIKLLDHIILGEDTYFSFTEETIKPYPKSAA